MNALLLICASLFFLFGTFLLTTVSSAFRRLHKRESKRQMQSLGTLFFYRKLHLYLFPAHEFEGIFFSTICAQNIMRFCYGASLLYLLLDVQLFSFLGTTSGWFWVVGVLFCVLLFSLLIAEFIPRILGNRYPEAALRSSAPLASIYLLLTLPFSFPFLKFAQPFSHKIYFDYLNEPEAKVKQEIIEIIQDADTGGSLEALDKKIIESVVTFRDRIVREVMVPRIDVFSLPADTSIREAAVLLEEEGYSRTPIYRNTIDNVVGVLMQKDILRKYKEYEQKGNDESILNAAIETLLKNVLYTPETKKISHLLQEFRKKQVHLAIVVDEYGGTAGIVTIEDILEEIVGEIADEYDEEEDELFFKYENGVCTADARMNILDVEEQLGLKIPQEGDYDTIGGYIFHRAGTIPSKGFVIYHDDFKLEVVKSNERSVEKVRITPKGK